MKAIIGVIFLVFVIIFALQQIEKDRLLFYDSLNGTTYSNDHDQTSEAMIRITISGCVKNPGSYTISSGSFLDDVITKAGGLLDHADTECFDFYLLLEEDLEIYIPKVSDELKISINDADLEKLKSLSGIGETIASRIIEYRNENGNFTYLEELMKVNGIGKAIFNKIKDQICL